MATVGYFEGTDPLVLTKLAAEGIDALPLSNGCDNYGKYVGHLCEADGVNAVVGPLHKVLIPASASFCSRDILNGCRTHAIPVLLVVPIEAKQGGSKRLEGMEDWVQLVAPEELYEKVIELCRGRG
jgi:hypothetical protein